MTIARDLLASMQQELDIIKHLYGKLPPGDESLEYRPAPGQRSTRELLTYIADCCWPIVCAMIAGDWAVAREAEKQIEPLEPDEFPSRIDRQRDRLAEALQPIADDQMRSQEASPPWAWGTKVTLHRALVDVGVKFLVAYRMQLFLHLKSLGVQDLTTINLWGGIDAMPANDR